MQITRITIKAWMRKNFSRIPPLTAELITLLITSVGEEGANLFAIFYLILFGFCSERFPFSLGTCDGLR